MSGCYSIFDTPIFCWRKKTENYPPEYEDMSKTSLLGGVINEIAKSVIALIWSNLYLRIIFVIWVFLQLTKIYRRF